ncbi:MAG: hypothetical protein KAH32_04745 [Chlamydiia bacterium]|nr:hypothetical protein [Chlamydiia bacterium]
MAEKKFYVDINLLQNQLKNGVIHKVADVASLPSGAEGQFAYVQNKKLVYVYDGADWKPIGDIPQFTGDVINTGLDMQIQPGVVGTTELADGAVTTPKIGDDAVTNAKLAPMNAGTIKANITASSANPQDVTYAQLADKLAVRSDLSLGTVGLATVAVDITTGSVNGDSVTLPAATTSSAGVMTKAQVDELAALTNAVTTISVTMTSGNATIDVNGVSDVIKLADGSNAGLMTSAEKGLIGSALQDFSFTLNQDGTKARIGSNKATNTIDILEVTTTRAGLMTPGMLNDLAEVGSKVTTIGYIQTNSVKNEITLSITGEALQKVDILPVTKAIGTNKAGLMVPADKDILDDLSPLTIVAPNLSKIVYTDKALISGGSLSVIDWISDTVDFGKVDGSEDSINSELIPTKTAVRKFIENTLEGIGEFRGSYDASTDSPGLDGGNGTQISDIVKGDYWIVSTDGDFFNTTTEDGIAVKNGDRIIANEDFEDMVNVPSIVNYTVVTPSFSNATENIHGLVELATEAEALTGTLHESAAITPKTLKYVLENGPTAGKLIGTFGDNIEKVFNIPHTFGDGVIVQLFDALGVQIEAQITTSAANVKLDFNIAPAANFKYVIIG